ncbi:MAG TPA: helix-turn-helix domain-containing protein, partial [Rhodospirillales bacterium]|nr:helix-turn-helix domain-containing protein [Rhodospirillales bacterium]
MQYNAGINRGFYSLSQLMTTREVAEYLRIKERKVYDLVREKRVPCTRVTGKWLFPKHLIDHWLATGTEFPDRVAAAAEATPSVCAGSHDPLLEWSLRESGCELAMMPGGSLDGLDRLAKGEAMVAGLHVYEPDTNTYNQAVVADACKGLDVVVIEWAWRRQGL